MYNTCHLPALAHQVSPSSLSWNSAGLAVSRKKKESWLSNVYWSNPGSAVFFRWHHTQYYMQNKLNTHQMTCLYVDYYKKQHDIQQALRLSNKKNQKRHNVFLFLVPLCFCPISVQYSGDRFANSFKDFSHGAVQCRKNTPHASSFPYHKSLSGNKYSDSACKNSNQAFVHCGWQCRLQRV